ncbi:MAG: hypothetical protein ACK41T_08490 [Pseudobdellovibrio sp.]
MILLLERRNLHYFSFVSSKSKVNLFFADKYKVRNERKLQNILTKLCGKLCERGSFNVISVTRSLIVFTIFSNILTYSFSVQASPGYTTYQAKIIKPDGYPLEATSVNFRFTVMDETASCILYTERYSAVNMH